MEPIRRFLLIVPVLLVLLLSGCQNAFGYINARWISEISLVYQPEGGLTEEMPFESKTFTDAASIKTMADAMNKSKKFAEAPADNANIKMKLVFGDGYTEEYSLDLMEEEGQAALLRSAKHTGKSYSISANNADKLRTLIYSGGHSTASSKAQMKEGNVTVQGPVTLSRNEFITLTGSPQFLNLQLFDGRYTEDWTTPSPDAGRSWSGQFQLTVTGEQGEILNSYALSEQFEEELSFGDLFQIQFGDYNSDGNPDFTIGQYGSSNGSFYKLFTLNKDNSIEELHITGISALFISSPERYSVKLEEIDGGFSASHYDNTLGKQVDNTYLWNGSAFQQNIQ